jgi:hypothetical protein
MITAPRLLVCFLLVTALPSCASLESLLALREVGWELDRVSELRLAGVDLDRRESYSDLTITDAARVAAALSDGRLPLDLSLHLVADNPDENPEARLLGMDWTLFLRDRETVSGRLERELRLPPGERTDLSMPVALDLLEFFDGGARDLVEVALSLTGASGEPSEVRLEILPTIETAMGPIRYPRPIVLGRTVGGNPR